jgi:hypothetical protein
MPNFDQPVDTTTSDLDHTSGDQSIDQMFKADFSAWNEGSAPAKSSTTISSEEGDRPSSDDDVEAGIPSRPSFKGMTPAEPEEPSKETAEVKGKAEAKAQPEAKEQPEKAEPEEDDDLESLQPPPNARPKTVADWHALKGKAKEYKGQYHAAAQRGDALQKENEELKAQISQGKAVELPDEVKREVEESRAIKRQLNIRQDPVFQAEYEAPVQEKFASVLRHIIELEGRDPNVIQWAENVYSKGAYAASTRDWDQAVLSKFKHDPVTHQMLTEEFAELSRRQNARHMKLQEVTQPGDPYNNYLRQSREKHDKELDEGVQEAIQRVAPTFGEWAMLKDLSKARNDAERTAWEAHNETYRKEVEETGKQLIGALRDDLPPRQKGVNRLQIVAEVIEGRRAKKELSAKLEQVEKELAFERSQNAKMTKMRGVPAKAGGVQKSSREKEPVDIFSNDPFRNGNAWGDE